MSNFIDALVLKVFLSLFLSPSLSHRHTEKLNITTNIVRSLSLNVWTILLVSGMIREEILVKGKGETEKLEKN